MGRSDMILNHFSYIVNLSNGCLSLVPLWAMKSELMFTDRFRLIYNGLENEVYIVLNINL